MYIHQLQSRNRWFAIVVVAVAAGVAGNALVGLSNFAVAAPSGDKIFNANCAACHMGGKNMVDPKKPIIGSKVIATKESLKAYLSKQQGTMPPFPKIAENDEALTALHTYLKSLK